MYQKYLELKAQTPEVIVFIRIGDFYETFDNDADSVSRELGIVLTVRKFGATEVKMVGVPWFRVNDYIERLTRAGLKATLVSS